MKRTLMDEAVSALKIAPIQTLGTGAGAVASLYLFSTDSQWCGTAVIATAIFTAMLWMATPGIIEVANKRAKARHRYPY